MKALLTATALLASALLFAQGGENNSAGQDDEPAHKRRGRIHDLQFDRVDYFYKNHLLQYTVHHNGGGGYPRTWRYFYAREGADALINRLKARYPNKKLHGATQVAHRNSVRYEVIMEDKRRWYIYETDTLGTISLKRKFRKH